VTAFSVLVTSTVSLSPRRAEALVGVASGAGIPVLVLGGAVAATGGGFALVTAISAANNPCSGLGCAFVGAIRGLLYLGEFVVLGIGLLILDGDSAQEIQFAELNEEEAQSLGIGSAELEAYNSDLSTINLIGQNITWELASRGPSADLELSQALWQQYAEEAGVAADSMAVIAKLAEAAVTPAP
ncbi:MAG: hypothetical protein AAB425_00500, partial [Bdellovibrionota bacterium]